MKKTAWLLWITAAIWGFAFVAQKQGMTALGPLAYNGLRFSLGGIVLAAVSFRFTKNQALAQPKKILVSGLATGIVLFVAATLQQVGLQWTSAGKAGFITGLYVVIVPVIAHWLGHRITGAVWIGALLMIAGMALLAGKPDRLVQSGDLLVLISAFFWAVHLMVIEKVVPHHHPLQVAALQFLVCGALSLASALVYEPVPIFEFEVSGWPVMYGGLMSVGIAYTLQVVAQRHVKPAHAGMILSFETVFALLGGILLLKEHISGMQAIGGGLMLLGMLYAQWRGDPGPGPTKNPSAQGRRG